MTQEPEKTARSTIEQIQQLQMEAEEAVKEAVLALQKADQLTRELKSVFGTGNRFVCGNHAWKLEHRAIGFIPGNRDWLVPDRDVTVIAG